MIQVVELPMDAKTSGPTFDKKSDIYIGPNYLPINYLLENERKNSNCTTEKYGGYHP